MSEQLDPEADAVAELNALRAEVARLDRIAMGAVSDQEDTAAFNAELEFRISLFIEQQATLIAERDAARAEVEGLKADFAKGAVLAKDLRAEEREACCEDIRAALTTGLLTPGQVQLAINTLRARGGR